MNTQELHNDRLHPIVGQLLSSRGISTQSDRAMFMNPDYVSGVHDPFLFRDMEKAVWRIGRSITEGELITIYGDYDVDGLTASAILYETLRRFGARVDVIFNHREHDGYGVCMATVHTLAEKGTKLIITTDSGITNYDEISVAGQLGVDTIVTDHHTVPTDPARIPPAVAIIHPTVYDTHIYPCRFLSGGGCAFKLSQGLLKRLSSDNPEQAFLYEQSLLDLVSLSIIADCVPLLDENRTLLHKGLEILKHTKRPGLRELISRIPAYYKGVSIHSLQFTVIPILNAASRMDHASKAFDLLVAGDMHMAQESADTLCSLNSERQKLSERTFRQAKKICQQQVNQDVLVASSRDWQLGVLGLVAGKISRLFDKPAVLISENDRRIAGVARSTPAIHIVDCFSQISNLFKRYGGHRAAGGFALHDGVSAKECIDAFANLRITHELSVHAKQKNDNAPIPICLSDISWNFVQDLMKCKPWGSGNQNPSFLMSDCEIIRSDRFGKNNKHTRLSIRQKASRGSVLVVGTRKNETVFTPGTCCDIVFEIDCREWFGRPEISLFFIDYTVHS